jgi:hypothetical protein
LFHFQLPSKHRRINKSVYLLIRLGGCIDLCFPSHIYAGWRAWSLAFDLLRAEPGADQIIDSVKVAFAGRGEIVVGVAVRYLQLFKNYGVANYFHFGLCGCVRCFDGDRQRPFSHFKSPQLKRHLSRSSSEQVSLKPCSLMSISPHIPFSL